MQLFIMGSDLLSSSISNVLPAFHSGLSPYQNLLLEGRQYVVDVDVDVEMKTFRKNCVSMKNNLRHKLPI